MAKGKKGYVIHRATPQVQALVERLSRKAEKVVGVPLGHSAVVELAIKHLAESWGIMDVGK